MTVLHRDGRTRRVADQLFRAVGSISANVAEGYSRGSGKDRARFYEYALGSAREARDWYFKARHRLGEDVAADRIEVLSDVIRLSLGLVRKQPGRTLREPTEDYFPDAPDVS
ncbi:MAG: four helix bundle protein [Bacteroidota bacterium]